MFKRVVFYALISCFSTRVLCLNNGLALRPPMGWMSWGYYECGDECDKNPDKCLNESLILSVVDHFYDDGFVEAGYEYIVIDDCWSEKQRDNDGNLVANKERFPSGMKYIADYIHKRGLKFGMYTNVAQVTCKHYPGSRGYFKRDAKAFAEWEIDYLKVDGCFVEEDFLNIAYVKLGKHLNMTGRPMVYACSWPYYIQFIYSHKPDFTAVVKHCNVFRNYHDIFPYWGNILGVIRFYEDNYETIATYHGPGQWFDPDMLLLGVDSVLLNHKRLQIAVYSMLSAPLLASYDPKKISKIDRSMLLNLDLISVAQDAFGIPARPYKLLLGVDSVLLNHKRLQIAVYSMLSAPLLASYDPKKISKIDRSMLLNLDLISVAQDAFGIPARPYKLQSTITVWVKQHHPRKGDRYPSLSFAFVNYGGKQDKVDVAPWDLGLNSTDGYSVLNIFNGKYMQNITKHDLILKVNIPPEDVVMYTMFPL